MNKICANCHKPIWFDSIPGRGWRHESPGGGGGYECYERKVATPISDAELAQLKASLSESGTDEAIHDYLPDEFSK